MLGRWLLAVALAVPGVAARADSDFVLVELFTSQGCYSCPPAEALVHEEYSKRDGVIALEFHVDYWDDLIYGLAGSWEDPFSNPQYTQRQRAYNIRLRRTGSVYTPQMIIHGQHQASGANRRVIDGFIQKAGERPAADIHLRFAPTADNGFTVDLEGIVQGNEDFYYAIYKKEATTEIPSGENKGKTLTSSHIVLDLKKQQSRVRRLTIPGLQADEGCAVWVQQNSGGGVLAAAPCPSV